ncbi:MAG: dockerin type I repeat-containing protein [Prevotella sp.]|nr:dockerin type I repeat-containing protein [Prevotella sp.]
MNKLRYILCSLLLLITGNMQAQSDFNPDDPAEPQTPVFYYRLTATCEPDIAGYASGSGNYAPGQQAMVSTSARSGFTFSHWTLNGERINDPANFSYTTVAGPMAFVAHYDLAPVDPAEPTMDVKSRLYLNSEPEGICTFNLTSGAFVSSGTGTTVSIIGKDSWYEFTGWYDGETKISDSPSFTFVPTYSDVTLTAHFIELPFTPSDPNEPNPSDGNTNVSGNVRLPNVPFEFFYNAFEYDEVSHSIPNHPQANLSEYSLQLAENIPEKMDDEMLRINGICKGYIDKWSNGSTESGSYFYRSGENCMTIVCKVSPNYGNGNNASDFICNRGSGYNYMLRIGDHGRLFLHTGASYSDSRSLALAANEPQVLAVRVDGKNNYILLENLTTGESLRVNGVNWGGSNNVFKLFYNDSGEYYLGDFYWMYYSFELLTDEQLQVFMKNILPGDVNGDGRVDLTDAIMIVYSSLGSTPNGFVEEAADVNNDGRIDLTDAIVVTYQSLGVTGNNDNDTLEPD